MKIACSETKCVHFQAVGKGNFFEWIAHVNELCKISLKVGEFLKSVSLKVALKKILLFFKYRQNLWTSQNSVQM